jgi:hypothetical protein
MNYHPNHTVFGDPSCEPQPSAEHECVVGLAFEDRLSHNSVFSLQYLQDTADEDGLEELAAKAKDLFMQLLRMSAETKQAVLEESLKVRFLVHVDSEYHACQVLPLQTLTGQELCAAQRRWQGIAGF